MAKTKTEINYIHLLDNYYYTADKYQYILVCKETRKKLELGTKRQLDEEIEAVSVLGYYLTLQQMLVNCANLLARNAVANEQVTTLNENIQMLNNTYNTLLNAVKLE